jgi:transcriptional regulatory protein LevR
MCMLVQVTEISRNEEKVERIMSMYNREFIMLLDHLNNEWNFNLNDIPFVFICLILESKEKQEKSHSTHLVKDLPF